MFASIKLRTLALLTYAVKHGEGKIVCRKVFTYVTEHHHYTGHIQLPERTIALAVFAYVSPQETTTLGFFKHRSKCTSPRRSASHHLLE